METNGKYFLVGLFTLILGAGLVFFAAWSMGVHESHDNIKLVIYFRDDVSGLDSGSAVRYRGVQVGSVEKVIIQPEDPEYIKVITQINPKTPLRENTKVTLQSQGVTGLNFIELESTDGDLPHLKPLPGHDYLVLYAQESTINRIIREAPILLERYTDVADHLLMLLDKENLDAVKHTLSNAEQFTSNIAQHQQEINKILDDTRNALESFKAMSSTSFTELDYFLQDSRKAANEITDLSHSLKQNPSQILYQPNYKGHKVNP